VPNVLGPSYQRPQGERSMAHHISEPFHHHTHTESSSGMPSIVLPTGCGQRAVDPMSVHGVVEHPYGAKRLTVPVPAVREFPGALRGRRPGPAGRIVTEMVKRQAAWSQMLGFIEAAAPHGALTYFRNDVHPVMELVGDGRDCVAYLMATTRPHCAVEGAGVDSVVAGSSARSTPRWERQDAGRSSRGRFRSGREERVRANVGRQ
jgi:hypothetical protein